MKRAVLALAACTAILFTTPATGRGAPAFERRLLTLAQPPETAKGRVAWRNAVRESQRPILEAIDALRAEGRAGEAKSHWLINSIAVEATPDAFDRLLRLFHDRILKSEAPSEIRIDPIPPPPPSREAAREPAGSSDYRFQVWDTFVYRVWEEFGLRGEGQIVGMVDTGIDPDHPEFEDKILGFKIFDETGRDSGLPAGDDYPSILGEGGHGTSVAGLLVGGSLSGKAIGMAPEAKILVSSFAVQSTANPGRSFPSKEALIASYEWLADPDGDPETEDGARVISGSYGGLQAEIFIPFAKAMFQNGVLIVNAMGNSGPDSETTVSPGNVPEYVVGVGAGGQTSEQGILYMASYSSRGPVNWDTDEFRGKFVKPDITAPSIGTYTTAAGGGYTGFGGTSAATPVVSGIALLLLQADPGLSPGEIMRLIEDTANVDESDGAPVPNNDNGYGFINAWRAAATVLEPGSVSVQVDIGPANSAQVRIKGAGFIRSMANGSTLNFDYAPGDYTLEIITDALETALFDFTVTAGQTTTIAGGMDGAGIDGGIVFDSESASLVPWHIFADGEDRATVDVTLQRSVGYYGDLGLEYRPTPAAGLTVKLNVLSGDVSVAPDSTLLDADGQAQFTIVAGTEDGKAELELVYLEPSGGGETTVETYSLRLHPARHLPPRIVSSEISPSNPTAADPVTVTAVIVSDDGGDRYPTLHYTTDEGGTWNSLSMTSSGSDRWAATIPAQPDGTLVRHYVSVSDEFGNYTTGSRGKTTEWPNPYAYIDQLTALLPDDGAEALYNQLPEELEWGYGQVLDDPLPVRRDIAGDMGVSHDDSSFYFRMRIPGGFEAADDLSNPQNAFAYGATLWDEDTLKWDMAAAWIPGANAVPEVSVPPLGLITPYNTYLTDKGLEIDFGDGLDLVFRVDRSNLTNKQGTDGSLTFSFSAIAVNIARFYVVEMDVTGLYRYYPANQAYSVPGGVQTLTLNPGWNLIGASALTDADNPAEVSANPRGVWQNLPEGRYVRGDDGEFTASAPQEAVWAYTPQSLSINVPPASGGPVEIPLQQGWNAIANPFAFPLAWNDGVTAVDSGSALELTLSEAAGQQPPWLGSALLHYDGEGYMTVAPGQTLEPGRGYFLRAHRDLTLKLPSP